MALTFPLTLDQFWATLPIAGMPVLKLPQMTAFNRTAGGDLLPYQTGVRLWTGSVALTRLYYEKAERIAALMSLLAQGGSSFLVCPIPRIGPQSDPAGSILGVSTPTIQALNVNNRELSVQGLPAGYVLSAGDYLSFPYQTPARQAFHQVVVGGVANGAGLAANIEVTPQIRPGVIVGASVTLKRPVMKAVLDPGIFDQGNMARVFTTGQSFAFQQTLRA